MWTDQILKIVLHDCFSASILTGIYSLNHLPAIVKAPAAVIVNLSPSYQQGTHWTCIVINKNNRAFYFDSLAQKPPKSIVHFLRRNSSIYRVNNVQYQADDSVLCGLFCLVYIYYKVRNINILKTFSKTNLQRNDQLVLNHVRKILKTKQHCKYFF